MKFDSPSNKIDSTELVVVVVVRSNWNPVCCRQVWNKINNAIINVNANVKCKKYINLNNLNKVVAGLVYIYTI